MKKTNKILSAILSFCLLFTLALQVFTPIASYASDETIYIESAEDFKDFAKKCSFDAWSVGKTVVLTKDISLEGLDLAPIPSFSGSFDGGNHVIGGFNSDGAYSPCGLFSSLEKDGCIKNLTVTGSLTPSGDQGVVGGIVGDNSGTVENCIFIGTVIGKSDVGGIAGINRLSGKISGCKVGGEIVGEVRTGGIAGLNEGFISSCQNNAKVNTISITPSLSLDQINVSLTLDITKLTSLNTLSMTDTGGITGYSTGMILGCVNEGRVGYPHVGYNVGGIVGRSCGHLSVNTNNAEIYGRKDVGGIVGQMEPDVSYNLSEDLLTSLKSELNELTAVVEGATDKAGSDLPVVSARFDKIISSLNKANDSLDSLIDHSLNYGVDVLIEVNRISEIVDEVISQINVITTDLPELTEIIGDGLESLAEAIEGTQETASLGASAIFNLQLAAKEASDAFASISDSVDKVSGGINDLRASIEIKDKKAFEDSIESISEGIGNIISSSENMISAIEGAIDVLGKAYWADDLITKLGDIAKVFATMSRALSDIYGSTLEIKDNVDVYWSKIDESSEKLMTALGCMSEATTNLNDALNLMESGLGGIVEGTKMLFNSISINDTEAAQNALAEIGDGFNQLVDASAKGTDALSQLSEAIRQRDDEDNSNILTVLADALSSLSDSGAEAAEAIKKLSDGMSVILDNVDVSFDTLTQSGSLIFGGVTDMSEALNNTHESTKIMRSGMQSLNEAIGLISESVVVKDEEKLAESLNIAYSALGDIIYSAEEFSKIFSNLVDIAKEAKLWSDELNATFDEVTKSLSSISDALENVREGVNYLRSNVSFDPDKTDSGLDLITEGLAALGNTAENAKNAFSYLTDALADIGNASSAIESTAVDLADAIYSFADAFDIISDMTDGINSLLGYLDGVDAIQIPIPDESIMTEAGQLFIYISEIEAELMYLNSDITNLSTDLIERIGKINELFNSISHDLVDMIFGLADSGNFDDKVSEEEIDSITKGKAFSCTNNGNVYGDINVGGISGTMGIEYSIDPEDDLSIELSITQKKQYKMKTVIHACKNNGNVTAKRDSVGGICGKMDIGLIYGCESYCNVQSEAGNYVGGIAGINAGLISQCFAKCTLSGGKYVGGIVGSGVSEDYSGDSSMVRNCCSMVDIVKFGQYSGAISGANIGEYSENLFVSDTLAGIDRVSYLGKAEPISYEDLIKRRSIPDGFYSFNLEFFADGKLISSTEFKYGDSFDSSVFPEIPKKDGYYGYWDRTDLTNLVFDTAVNVIYKAYTTAIGSVEARDDGKEIFFVEGEFTENDILIIENGADISDLSLPNRFFTKDTLSESWILTVPKDNLDKNTVHYLPATDHSRIFVKLDGVWTQVEADSFGSYLIFEVDGEDIEVAIVTHTVKILPIVLLSIPVAAGLTVGIILLLKKKKSKSPEASSEKNTVEVT